MDDDTHRLLEETRALAKDNQRMLRKIQRNMFLSLVVKIVIWAGLLLVPVYLYQQFLHPIISTFVPSTSTTTESANGMPL